VISTTVYANTYNELPTGKVCQPGSNIHTGSQPHDFLKADFADLPLNVSIGAQNVINLNMSHFDTLNSEWLPLELQDDLVKSHGSKLHGSLFSADLDFYQHIHPPDSDAVGDIRMLPAYSGPHILAIFTTVNATKINLCVSESSPHRHGEYDRNYVYAQHVAVLPKFLVVGNAVRGQQPPLKVRFNNQVWSQGHILDSNGRTIPSSFRNQSSQCCADESRCLSATMQIHSVVTGQMQAMDSIAVGACVLITISIKQDSGAIVDDLQQYLEADGHIVTVSSDVTTRAVSHYHAIGGIRTSSLTDGSITDDMKEKCNHIDYTELNTNNQCLQPATLKFGAEAWRGTFGWVCCTETARAEPSDIAFDTGSFDSISSETGQVTFYDPQCGIALFVAPSGRTMQEFLDESRLHGWPSFRPEELVADHVIVKSSGEVVSACGTHLGHDTPDDAGTRYCINLICISGHASNTPWNATSGSLSHVSSKHYQGYLGAMFTAPSQNGLQRVIVSASRGGSVYRWPFWVHVGTSASSLEAPMAWDSCVVPLVETVFPLNNSMGAGLKPTLQVLFTKPVTHGTGMIMLSHRELESSGGTNQMISAQDPCVTLNSLTVNISLQCLDITLESLTQYEVTMETSSFVDLYPRPSSLHRTHWRFETMDASLARVLSETAIVDQWSFGMSKPVIQGAGGYVEILSTPANQSIVLATCNNVKTETTNITCDIPKDALHGGCYYAGISTAMFHDSLLQAVSLERQPFTLCTTPSGPYHVYPTNGSIITSLVLKVTFLYPVIASNSSAVQIGPCMAPNTTQIINWEGTGFTVSAALPLQLHVGTRYCIQSKAGSLRVAQTGAAIGEFAWEWYTPQETVTHLVNKRNSSRNSSSNSSNQSHADVEVAEVTDTNMTEHFRMESNEMESSESETSPYVLGFALFFIVATLLVCIRYYCCACTSSRVSPEVCCTMHSVTEPGHTKFRNPVADKYKLTEVELLATARNPIGSQLSGVVPGGKRRGKLVPLGRGAKTEARYGHRAFQGGGGGGWEFQDLGSRSRG